MPAAAYGIPSKLYVDNGCSCSNEQLSLICGSVGIVLLHTRIRDGASKAKTERQFRTLRETWLYTLDLDSITSLKQFDSLLKDYKMSREKDRFLSKDISEMINQPDYLKDTRGIGVFTARPGMGKSFGLRCFAITAYKKG